MVCKDKTGLILEKIKVASFPVKIIFPMVGGYGATTFDYDLNLLELPEEKDFKYLWRWWSRVLIAPGEGDYNYIDLDKKVGKILGSTGDNGKGNVSRLTLSFKITNDIDRIKIQDIERLYKMIIKAVENAYNTVSEDKRNGIKISFLRTTRNIYIKEYLKKVSSNDKTIIDLYDLLESICRIPRIRLLHQPSKEREESNSLLDFNPKKEDDKVRRYIKRVVGFLAIPKEVPGVIEVYKLDSKLENTIIKKYIASLFISLLFGAIGSGSSRGFGSIIFDGAPTTIFSDLDSKFRDIISELRGHGDGKIIREKIIRLLEDVGLEVYKGHDIPRIPVLSYPRENNETDSETSREIFRLDLKVCRDSDVISVLQKLNRVFVRTSLIGRKTGRALLSRYLLGLPRYRMEKRKENGKENKYVTGFQINNTPGRRRSAIAAKIVAVRKHNNGLNEYVILIYGQLTREWIKKELMWQGVKRKRKETKIRRVFSKRIFLDESTLLMHFNDLYERIIKGIC